MDYRRANRAYLYTVLTTLAFFVLYAVWVVGGGAQMPLTINNLLSESVLLLPVLAVVLYSGDRLSVVIPLRKIKISSVLLTILYTALLYPLVTFINSISMLFVDNAVLEISDQILSMPMWTMVFFVGIFGPFVEEIVFRGVLLQSYQRSGRIIASIFLSSLLFGLAHMNFNQLAYGTVMGIAFALLVEATGSVLTSFICHMSFNTAEVLFMFAQKDALMDASSMLESGELGDNLPFVIGIYFILALIGTVIALCVAVKISDVEGRKEFFVNIPKCPKQGYKLITAPLIIGVVIVVLYMLLTEFLTSLV